MSIVIKLPNHGESLYATDEGRLRIFLVDVITCCLLTVYIYLPLGTVLESSFFYMSNR